MATWIPVCAGMTKCWTIRPGEDWNMTNLDFSLRWNDEVPDRQVGESIFTETGNFMRWYAVESG